MRLAGPNCAFLIVANVAGFWAKETRTFTRHADDNQVVGVVLGQWKFTSPHDPPLSGTHKSLQEWAIKAAKADSIRGYLNYIALESIAFIEKFSIDDVNLNSVYASIQQRTVRVYDRGVESYIDGPRGPYTTGDLVHRWNEGYGRVTGFFPLHLGVGLSVAALTWQCIHVVAFGDRKFQMRRVVQHCPGQRILTRLRKSGGDLVQVGRAMTRHGFKET